MRSLRAQLSLRLLIGGALLLGASAIALDWQVRRALLRQLDESLIASVQALASLTEQHGEELELEVSPDSIPQFESPSAAQVFTLSTETGVEIARSRSLGDATLPRLTGSLEACAFSETTLPDGRRLRCAGARFLPRQEETGTVAVAPKRPVVLVVGRDRRGLERTLADFGRILFVVSVSTVAVLLGLVRWGVRSGLAPLERLVANVKEIDARSLATRLAEPALPAELQPIAACLNGLLARLESAFERERRFTATAAHELRTPLAELRAVAEVSLSTPGTEAERLEAWRDALATTLHMEALALRLLELARTEDATRVIEVVEVGAREAFEAAFRPWAARAALRGLTLENAIPADLRLRTDPALLGVALGNLCANAAEHAPEGSPVRVEGGRSPHTVTLRLSNRAGAISEGDLPRLFERFWQKDASRSQGRHHGLGLALAADFAELLGGNLTAALTAGGELAFTLQLPDELRLSASSSHHVQVRK